MFTAAILSLFLLDPPVFEKVEIKDVFSEKQEKVVIKDLNGNEFKWNNFKGKVVLVNIWATWCPYCVEELPSMAKLYKKFADNPDVIFVFYSDESYLKLKRFNEKNKPGLPICYSKSGRFPLEERNNQTNGGLLPVTYVISKDGQEIHWVLGSADWNDSKAAELIEQLLKK